MDLFELKSSKKIFHANYIEKIFDTQLLGTHPYVVRMTKNNGIKGYIIEDEHFLNEGKTLSFAQDTFTVFYQKNRYFTGNKVKILKPKFSKDTDNIMNFITSCFEKALCSLSWGVGSNIDSINNTIISLPTKKGEIDFEFMESFVAELEAQRVAELEAYLTVTGLKDYTLTVEEQQALDDYSNLDFEEFNVLDVFDVNNTKNILSRDIIENSGSVPYLCASSENNSISSYISYKDELIDRGNCVFIGGKTFVVSYQEKDFYSNDSHNLALHLKQKEQKSKLTHLFLATCIKKSLSHKYSWGNSISKAKIKKDKVALPVCNSTIQYDMMDTLISAIQKLVIKDVVDYADEKIKATKNIIKTKH